MQIHVERMILHHRTDRCNRTMEMRLQRRDVEISQREGDMKFSLYVREYYPLTEEDDAVKVPG